MHSRLSRVLLSCRCLYGPLEAAQSWAFARAVLQRSSKRIHARTTRSLNSATLASLADMTRNARTRSQVIY